MAVALICATSVFAAGADLPTDPIPAIGPLPFVDTGNTIGATNTITFYGGASTLPFPYGGEDHIYSITLGEGNNVEFSMDLAGSAGDLALFLLSDLDDGDSTVANSPNSSAPLRTLPAPTTCTLIRTTMPARSLRPVRTPCRSPAFCRSPYPSHCWRWAAWWPYVVVARGVPI
jgi:hypothetical protein